MIGPPEGFRDLLIALVDAGAEFVVPGGHAVAVHGHPRATQDLGLLIRATPVDAACVYRALAAFGATLDEFQVTAADFASHDGVLQTGVPPRRIDAVSRADGIRFDDAIEAGDAFYLEGRRIPLIGLQALLRNKRAQVVSRGAAGLVIRP